MEYAPFVRIIGLFSNALEDPGLISSQKNQKTKWPGVPDDQLAFLTAQLQNIKTQNYAGAVLIAVHHPPFSYAPTPKAGGGGGNHLGNTLMLREIDTVYQAQGVYPHAFLSGHAHNYQRYTRKLTFGGKNYSVPFIVAGDGGFNVKPLVYSRGGVTPPAPAPGTQVSYLDPNPAVQAKGLTIDQSNQTNYGYLRITVNSKQIRIEIPSGEQHRRASEYRYGGGGPGKPHRDSLARVRRPIFSLDGQHPRWCACRGDTTTNKNGFLPMALEKSGLTAKRYGIVRLYPSRTAVALSLP